MMLAKGGYPSGNSRYKEDFMINGYATSEDTGNYLDRHSIVKRDTPWFSFSPIAIGTHLGNMNETDSKLYQTFN